MLIYLILPDKVSGQLVQLTIGPVAWAALSELLYTFPSWPAPDLLACHPMTHFSANKSSELALTFGFPSLTTV